MDASVALMALPLLPTKKAPAPAIITNSSGWNKAAKCPPLSAKPPNTEAQTRIYPIMTNKCGDSQGDDVRRENRIQAIFRPIRVLRRAQTGGFQSKIGPEPHLYLHIELQ